MNYELIEAKDCFDDNDDLIFGIYWLDENNNVIDCTWYKTEAERLNDLKAVENQILK